MKLPAWPAAAFATLMICAGPAGAALIVSTVGNDTPGFADGDSPTILQLIAAQGGQPAPFDSGRGNDLLENLSESWTHTFGAIADTILSATWRFGIADHDSAWPGDQVGSFSYDSTDGTAGLNALFNASGGADNEYNIYELTLGAGAFGDLADGSMTFSLTLAGPTESCGLFGCILTDFNGAHLIFSELSITTRDMVPMSEPPVWFLLLAGVSAIAVRRRASTERGQATHSITE